MKRNDFIKRLGLLTGSSALHLNGIPIQAFQYNSFKVSLEATKGKILVLLQMQGGNDGLNTVVPIEDANYYNARKTVNIAKTASIKINNTIGLHSSLEPIKKLYDKGMATIVQNVGYEQPDRSHFRATDIWLSASDAKQYLYEGWAARFLELQNPNYPAILPQEPMAIQLGSVESMLLQGKFGSLGTVFDDPNQFYQLINGSSVDNDLPPNNLAGNELKFLRNIATASIAYSTQIKEKADKGKNKITYPNTNLGRQLAIVAKLISGGLQTPVYLTTIGGFDTHANQITTHANLLTQVSQAIAAFQTDIETLGIAENITLMTFSEFGRRVKENGTSGTDHGSAAPLFVIGKTVKGGILGANPNLKNLDNAGDIKHEFDFRRIYSTIIMDHFGLQKSDMQAILFKDFAKLPIFKTTNNDSLEASISLSQNAPNPAGHITTINFTNSKTQNLSLELYDLQGTKMATITDKIYQPGVYSEIIYVNDLPQGIYAYSLLGQNGERKTLRMLVKR